MLRPKRTSGNCGVIFLLLFLSMVVMFLFNEFSRKEQQRKDEIEQARKSNIDNSKRNVKQPILIPKGNGVYLVHKNHLGEKWPLTVDSCRIHIVDAKRKIIAISLPGGKYALNGKSQVKFAPLTPSNKYWKSTDYGTKESIGPLIDLALSFCEK